MPPRQQARELLTVSTGHNTGVLDELLSSNTKPAEPLRVAHGALEVVAHSTEQLHVAALHLPPVVAHAACGVHPVMPVSGRLYAVEL